ncbi:MAG: FAD-binding oxidoreductase [Rhodobacteraceae bacterium]|nr:FAD-binding oxidoreductase [Paracoccaceae bacterium]
MDTNISVPDNLVSRLAQIVGEDHVLTGEAREFYATDVYRRMELPLAVVRPGTVDEMCSAVAAAYAADVAIVARGGGASYTAGYLPSTKRSIILDAGRLNRIVEINQTDMYVTVEPGLTWAELDGTLAKLGLRTPFRGPFSGLAATVGGSISQNTLGFGTNTWGVSCDSVLALEVVTADGAIFKTGQAGSKVGKPFFRQYGPDLTGLFTGDCGALGFKARITLKMMKRRPHFDCVSFGFDSFEQAHAAISEIAGHVAEEKMFALDTALQQGQIGKSSDLSNRVDMAKSVVAAAESTIKGLKQIVGMGLAGAKALTAAPFAAHYLFEGLSEGETKGRAALLRGIAKKHGREIPNSVPLVVRAMPFAPLHNILGPAGERWVPLHGILPASTVVAFHHDVKRILDSYGEKMNQHGVHVGIIFSALGTGAFLYEPAIYWKDELTVYHRTMLDEDFKSALPSYPANPQGAALVRELRTDLLELFHRYGAAHLQVGKQYPLLRDRNPGAVAMLRAIKAAVDPKGLFNPGTLGL